METVLINIITVSLVDDSVVSAILISMANEVSDSQHKATMKLWSMEQRK
jgi:hypothetical protein